MTPDNDGGQALFGPIRSDLPRSLPPLGESAEHEPEREKKRKKSKDRDRDRAVREKEKSSRGIETMFRNSYRTHIDMSGLADSKANIMISINGLITGIVLGSISTKIDANSWLLHPHDHPACRLPDLAGLRRNGGPPAGNGPGAHARGRARAAC